MVETAKRSFYRSFNAIFGKIGNLASEETIIELLTKKCLPVLFYGLEACFLSKSQINSLSFAIISSVMKIFRTSSKTIAMECMSMFNLLPASDSLVKRRRKFLSKYCNNLNIFCQMFAATARQELRAIE